MDKIKFHLIENTPTVVFVKSWIQSNQTRSSTSKIKASIMSLIIGFIVSIIFIAISSGANGFEAFTDVFKLAFNPIMMQNLLATTAIMVMAAAANAIAFKTGLFNIGVSGQVFASGALSLLLLNTAFKSTGLAGNILLFFIAMIFGGIVAGFAGLLKSRFNVHEVVSTILLNWGLFYLAKWFLLKFKSVYNQTLGQSVFTTNNLKNTELDYHSSGTILIIIAIIVSIFLAFMFWKTTWGFKLKATGLSPDAVEYAGINKRRQIVFAMATSGIVSGAVTWMSYFNPTTSGEVMSLSSNTLPTIGFDGIAISLVAWNSFVGIIPISFIFSALSVAKPRFQMYDLSDQVPKLIVGLVMYFAALSIVFVRFRVLQMIYSYIKMLRSDHYKLMHDEYKTNISLAKQKSDAYKITNTPVINKIKTDLKKELSELKLKLNAKDETKISHEQYTKQMTHLIKKCEDKINAIESHNESLHHLINLKEANRINVSLLLENIRDNFDKKLFLYAQVVKTDEYNKIKKKYESALHAKKNGKKDIDISLARKTFISEFNSLLEHNRKHGGA